ncbi:DUF3185 family protein [Alkalimonas sp. MEB108]|uniref:DUF3185 family protein n=1 Tax=Alkalimonas cellulosilytica TaxID=3058395 RepID=A0ABU7J531_9GAMM|nr:DUF3185 family protein [Alkalimonas sp. MEB108]MEE2001443.1 DUF3185 family protein [Alkalimonas sp. MEB108]
MQRIIGIAALVAGAILLYFAYTEYNSTASQITEAITGNPTDNTVLYLIGGVVAVIIGLGLLLRKGR